MSMATAFSTVQTLDYGGVQLIRRDMTEAIEACEENPAPQQVRFENEFFLYKVRAPTFLLFYRTGLFGAKIPKSWTRRRRRV